jgi:hypothetical protein
LSIGTPKDVQTIGRDTEVNAEKFEHFLMSLIFDWDGCGMHKVVTVIELFDFVLTGIYLDFYN